MEEISHSLNFPTFEDIVKTNLLHLELAGQRWVGVDNLKDRGSLEWVLEVIQYPLFGVDRYPTLAEKAAILAWKIIAGHVFWDGNKRTGMSILHGFLRRNGYRLDISQDEVVEIACRIAGKCSGETWAYEDFAQWVRDKMVFDEGAVAPALTP